MDFNKVMIIIDICLEIYHDLEILTDRHNDLTTRETYIKLIYERLKKRSNELEKEG